MSAKDIYHDTVVRALQKDGWSVTHENFIVPFGKRGLYVDIAADPMVAAERGDQRIAVEVKSFLKPSPVQDLKEAVGQFFIYLSALQTSDEHKDRLLYLAVRDEAYNSVFKSDDVVLEFVRGHGIHLIVFDPINEVINEWIR